tara:strand:+ start:455 stop:1636 length:1182 start_codon:yes stop_codon:yes gene_type:complete
MKLYISLILVTLSIFSPKLAIAQNSSTKVSLEGEIFSYATYYVSSFDIGTGATNVQIFRYRLEASQYPIPIKIRFRASMISPQLGINSSTAIIEILTNTFELKDAITLDNREISSETAIIYDMATPPNPIELTGQIIESLDPLQADVILQSILTTGRISDGIYRFEIEILHGESEQQLAYDERTINVESPVSISLESPGGALSDTVNNLVYTTFPTFQWFAQTGEGFSTFIRVAEFNTELHSSPEDAIEDQRVLPFDQTLSWFDIPNMNSFQYPFTGAYPLEQGKIYVWQIMKTMPTTAGAREMLSPIYSFKIGVSGQVELTTPEVNPLLIALRKALGDQQFNSLFGDGNELHNYFPTGQLEINGVNVDEAGVNYLLNQINSQNYNIQGLRVE